MPTTPKPTGESPKSPPQRRPSATSPSAFVTTGEAMVLFKAGELGVQAAKKLADWLQSEGPLVVQVLKVGCTSDEYVVQFRATNQTVHGLYLLNASLSWPWDIAALPLYRQPADVSFGGRPPMEVIAFPVHVASATSIEFYVRMRLPSKSHLDGGLTSRRVGLLKLTFQLLNKESSDSRSVNFSIILPAEA